MSRGTGDGSVLTVLPKSTAVLPVSNMQHSTSHSCLLSATYVVAGSDSIERGAVTRRPGGDCRSGKGESNPGIRELSDSGEIPGKHDSGRRENAFGLTSSLNMLIENGDAFDYTGSDFAV